jgi:HNH endonuclease
VAEHAEAVRAVTVAGFPCRFWDRYIGKDGYGRQNRRDYGRTPQLAHRIAYEDRHGPIPAGLELHHLCGEPACIEPRHLVAVLPQDHKKVEAALRTHCRRGHAYAEHGRLHVDGSGRYCRACERENERNRAAVSR